MKDTIAIILAGGLGKRLYPNTEVISKQLINIYDKPMIYYQISFLIRLKIKKIYVISDRINIHLYQKLLNKFNNKNLNIKFLIQKHPAGIPEAFIIANKFIKNNMVILLLGDNFFYSDYVIPTIKKNISKKVPTIFLKKVKNPYDFGVIRLKKNKILDIVEKPKEKISNLAITGLYIFDQNVKFYSRNLNKSNRGELEIVDIIKIYIRNKNLSFCKLSNNCYWSDNGSPNNLFLTSNFVRKKQIETKKPIGSIEYELLYNKLISKNHYNNLLKSIPDSDYKKNL